MKRRDFIQTTTLGLGSLSLTYSCDLLEDIYPQFPGTIYVATSGGLSISNNSGNSFSNKTTTDGLGSNTVSGIFVY